MEPGRGWQTSAPDVFRNADEGTQISCITNPTWWGDDTMDELQLQAASELTYCLFRQGNRLVEVHMEGQNWTSPGLVF
ncbi:hypothetical protein B0I35DRAFT_420838 [Stachybotrys elegans]|uniref:Uncharacterized protein n=1 Tax=Stachybotrys elegans TaxID=80388 RepID=A0A8K0WUZ7_9HYPO|nr:hypothetical protein B0I35DRAFT_420838 [Stachybotrys elegans]